MMSTKIKSLTKTPRERRTPLEKPSRILVLTSKKKAGPNSKMEIPIPISQPYQMGVKKSIGTKNSNFTS